MLCSPAVWDCPADGDTEAVPVQYTCMHSRHERGMSAYSRDVLHDIHTVSQYLTINGGSSTSPNPSASILFYDRKE